jgi:hypothetical protein
MINFFKPNITKVVNAFINEKKYISTLIIEFLPLVFFIIIFSLLGSYFHLNQINKNIIENNKTYSSKIYISNLSLLTGPLFSDFNNIFRLKPLISYFKLIDINDLSDQYFEKSQNKINLKKIDFAYNDNLKNSINISLEGESNVLINKKIITEMIEQNIYKTFMTKLEEEITTIKEILRIQIDNIEDLINTNTLTNNNSLLNNYSIQPVEQKVLLKLCNSSNPEITKDIKTLLNCENSLHKLSDYFVVNENDLSNTSFSILYSIKVKKIEKMYSIHLLNNIEKFLNSKPHYAYSYDQIQITSYKNLKNYLVFLIYYFFSSFMFFLIIYNFLILINYHKKI